MHTKKRNIHWGWARKLRLLAPESRAFVLTGLLCVVVLGTLMSKSMGMRLIGEVLELLPQSETPEKSDDDLIAVFRAHRAEFDRLLRMVIEDKALYRVDYNWTEPENPESVAVTKERIDEYRNLMKKLGILRGFSAYRERMDIEFITSGQGFATHGSMKGYLHAKEPPLELDPNLDESIRKGDYYGYRRIEGNWYLFFRKD